MWNFDVLSINHIPETDKQLIFTEVLEKIPKATFESYIIVSEMGKQGTNEHFNICYYCIKESSGKSFRQNIKRYISKLNEAYYTTASLKHSSVYSEKEYANVVIGYLTDNENKDAKLQDAKIRAQKNTDIEKLKSLREIKKEYKRFARTPTLMKVQMTDMFKTHYWEEYPNTPFNFTLFKKMLKEIHYKYSLTGTGAFKQIRETFLELELQLASSPTAPTPNYDKNIEMVFYDYLT